MKKERPTERLNLLLKKSTMRRIKAEAAERDDTLSNLVREILEASFTIKTTN
jgi:hypothetical protein